jgi:hypothetical protein
MELELSTTSHGCFREHFHEIHIPRIRWVMPYIVVMVEQRLAVNDRRSEK